MKVKSVQSYKKWEQCKNKILFHVNVSYEIKELHHLLNQWIVYMWVHFQWEFLISKYWYLAAWITEAKTIEANTTAENTARLSLIHRWANFIGYAPTFECHFKISATLGLGDLGRWIWYWCGLTIWRLNRNISKFRWREYSTNWVIRVVEVIDERDRRRWSIDSWTNRRLSWSKMNMLKVAWRWGLVCPDLSG